MQTVTAGGLLVDVNDPTSNFSQLVAAGDYQAALGYTYAKISLINLPPNLVNLYYFSFRSYCKLFCVVYGNIHVHVHTVHVPTVPLCSKDTGRSKMVLSRISQGLEPNMTEDTEEIESLRRIVRERYVDIVSNAPVTSVDSLDQTSAVMVVVLERPREINLRAQVSGAGAVT